jgi:hypothetical protein
MVGAGSCRDLADHPFSPHRARSYVEGDRFCDVGRELWPIILFAAIMLVVAVKRYRQTLD